MGRKDDDAPLEALPSGFTDRTLVNARLATRLGASALKRTLGFGKKDASAERAARAVHDATALVRELGRLKGLVMKVGQMASYLPGALPDEAQEVLARLQAETQPLSFARVREVVARELGDEPSKLFDRFDETPFAAASIGQVHRARLGDRELAVKVQYPGVDEVLDRDLSAAAWFLKMSAMGTPIDAKVVAAELRARVLEECDYLREADAQERFRALLQRYPRCEVPEVVRDRTGRRVLTAVFADGAPFSRFRAEAIQAEKDTAGAAIFETCFRCIFEHCVYNADPHPGNYLFRRDGRVVFLDFGCVRRFDPTMIATWKRFALAVRAGNRAEFREALCELGLARTDDRKFDWEHQWEVTRYLYTPFLSTTPFTYTSEYVRSSYGLMIFDNPNKMRTCMPPEWLFLNRLQWGLNAILAQLGATGPWPDLWWSAVESPAKPAF
ncbi:MAG: AarF/ABC1/UbiB kinase family protein [Deltaproteobacteria bacterium]|nr:AarF/ABC1/UbiB kinase family protein [Deltaproteobacteria bacterium]